MPTKPLIEKLHELLVEELTSRLIKGEQKVTNDGDVILIKACPATLAVIAKFLKDNHIEPGSTDQPELQRLSVLLSGAKDRLEDYDAI